MSSRVFLVTVLRFERMIAVNAGEEFRLASVFVSYLFYVFVHHLVDGFVLIDFFPWEDVGRRVGPAVVFVDDSVEAYGTVTAGDVDYDLKEVLG